MTELERRVRRWRFERIRALLVEGAARMAAGSAGFLLTALAMDALFSLPQDVRWGIFGAGALALLAGAYRCFVGPLAALAPAQLFRGAAARYPSLSAYLRSAWELSRLGPPAHTSPELAKEHSQRADKLLRDLPGETIFPWRPSRASARSLTFVAAAWGLGLPWLRPGHGQVGRILAPWSGVRLETLLDVSPGDEKAGWGQPVEITAAWREGRVDSALSLELRSPGSSWRKVPWDSEGRSCGYRIESLTSALEYRVGYKDLRTRPFSLSPRPVPHLTRLKVRVQRPGEEGPEGIEMPLEGGVEVAALRGSWVSLTGVPDQPLEAARLDVSFLSTPVKMKELPSGEWGAGFPLNENGTLKLDLTSAEGTRDPDPLAYGLRALDDQPPSVELLSPAFELEISPKDKLPVAFSARDDYGLASVSLVYQAPGREETEIPIRSFPRGTRETLGDYSWDLAGLPMGARVEFRIKARDNARPRGQSGFSSKGILHVTDFESAHRETESRWRDAQQRLKTLAESEDAAKDLMKALAQASEASRPGRTQEADRMERSLDGQWSEAADSLSELGRSMAADPFSNPGMAEAAASMAEALKAARDSSLSKSKEQRRAGDFSAAGKTHSELAARARRAASELAGGRELQAMQDFLGEAYRMDQTGAELEKALSKASSSGQGPSAAERAKLDQALADLRAQMDSLAQTISALPKAEAGSFEDKNRKVYTVPLSRARTTAEALQQALNRGHFAAAAELARQLSRELQEVRSAIAQAARSAIEEGPEGASASGLEEAAGLWKEAVESQSQGLQLTQKEEAQRQAAAVSAQENLLKDLARDQAAVLRDAQAAGGSVPYESLDWMRRVLKEFEAGQVRESPQLLDRTSARLREQSSRYVSPEGPGAALSALAGREDEIRARLRQGAAPAPPSESLLSGLKAAGAAQRDASKKTGELQGKLSGSPELAGSLPAKAGESLQSAQAEQRSAEAGFAAGDGAAAQSHQEKALEHLEEGLKSLGDALKQQQSIRSGSAGGFSGPRGVVRPSGRARGRTGADVGFVPLPRAEDYQPPKEIRSEVEKSLRERRPSSFDEVIKDYFKRMSQ